MSRVEWDVRSLKDFGEVPLADLIDGYDLLVIDHPLTVRFTAAG